MAGAQQATRLERSYWVELLETLLLVGAVYLATTLLTARFVVEGPSMQPNLETGQFLVVDRTRYLRQEPEYGDLVVFHYPQNPTDDYVKRVVGLPGDTVVFKDAQLYVNDVAVREPYINEPCHPERCEDARWTLGTDEFFVMGDNRNYSQDSRTFGPVPRRLIIGEAWLRYWPPAEWRNVRKLGYTGTLGY